MFLLLQKYVEMGELVKLPLIGILIWKFLASFLFKQKINAFVSKHFSFCLNFCDHYNNPRFWSRFSSGSVDNFFSNFLSQIAWLITQKKTGWISVNLKTKCPLLVCTKSDHYGCYVITYSIDIYIIDIKPAQYWSFQKTFYF